MHSPKQKSILKIIIFILFVFIVIAIRIEFRLNTLYKNIESTTITDRNNETVLILPNERDNYSTFATSTPPLFIELLKKSEDKYFYYHLGINPVGTIELLLSKIGIGRRKSASTIDQQLTKILFENETKRNVLNKTVESFSALIIDIFKSKE